LIVSRGATESFRVDASSRLLVGTSSAHNVGGALGNAQFSGAGTQVHFVSTSTSPSYVNLAAGSSGTNVTGSTTLGRLRFYGYHTNGYDLGAQIEAPVDGTPSDGDMPTRLVFSTTADGAASPTERLRITSAGRVGIGSTTVDNKLQVVGDVGIGDIGTSGTYDLYWAPNTAGGSIRWFRSEGSAFSLGIGTTAGISEHLKADGSGRLLVGTSTAVGGGSSGELLQVGFSGGSRAILANTSTSLASGALLGQIDFTTNVGSSISTGASIKANCDGTAAVGDAPTRLTFSTTADGASRRRSGCGSRPQGS
jgi:hypothetical protein